MEDKTNDGQQCSGNFKSNSQTTTESSTTLKKAFPRTDSQMVGWKSAVAKRNPYGVPENQARGKCDILRTFDWPQESQ